MDNEPKEKSRFCADCKIEHKVSELKRRKSELGFFNKREVIEWLCLRCASRY